MKREELRSRGIRSAGYDEERRVLEVEFASGGVYRYLEVPEEVFAWLLRVRSKGAFVSRMVRDRYAFEKVNEGHDPHDADLESQLKASLETTKNR